MGNQHDDPFGYLLSLGCGSDLKAKMKKKLIEVALPLEAINKEAARERSLRHGHPSTLHRWWSRKPLSAARAVLFATLVDDPSSHPESFPSPAEQNQERQRLFGLIERLVSWDYLGDRTLLDEALRETADLVLSLGPMTWPHLLVRGLLAEQLYRAQQIALGHPYHRA